MAQFQFDGDQVNDDVIPAGTYVAIAAHSEIKMTKDQRGEYLNFRFVICEGDHKDESFFVRFNSKNANSMAVKIGMKQLKQLGVACGKLRFSDTQELHNIRVAVTLKVKDGPMGPQNEVAKFEAVGHQGGANVVQMPTGPSMPSGPAHSGAAMPTAPQPQPQPQQPPAAAQPPHHPAAASDRPSWA